MKLRIIGNSSVGFSAHGEWDGNGDLALDSCPFCGSNNLTVENTHTPFYNVTCEDCGADGPDGVPNPDYDGKRIRSKVLCGYLHQDAFANAIALWNDRIVSEEEE